MPTYAYAALVVGWLLWWRPSSGPGKREACQANRPARRWGILLCGIAYTLLCRPFLGAVLAPLAGPAFPGLFLPGHSTFLDRRPARSAANGESMLVSAPITSSSLRPYRFVRHPIYTSMLSILLGTGFF